MHLNNSNYESIMRDRVITALEVYQRETHGLILIAGTEIETMSMEAYNNFAASLKFKGCPSILSYMPGVPAGNKERLTDLKHVGTLTKRIGVLKSYF